MKLLVLCQVIVILMTTRVYQADCLLCPSCNYIEPLDIPALPGSGLQDFIADYGVNKTCKDGSADISTSTCGSPAASKKYVCINMGVRVAMQLKLPAAIPGLPDSVDFRFIFYRRTCEEIDTAAHPDDTGVLELSETSTDFDSMASTIEEKTNAITTVKSLTGSAIYCTTDRCGATDGISGVGGVLPSLVLTTLLAVLTTISWTM